ncbi:hypothetical protein HPC49_24185 [Pyxidicoccus fallax]|uniref:Uncharacterized protein n=1 Tax=Pyxidicoccus fallax TaxID=394095 RepID=A0A848LB90_9BACT|nr:hypothetical protein [Pyxidicoccus fallax]NMO15907.1 hypothetical protein [Pyxidicoccus fallax]NPC81315.1 hypothetical protein [Pyxidicoccus fallax]
MEIGEGVNVALAASAELKPWKLRAEILEVTFKNGILVSRDGSTVPLPHWEKGVDVSDEWTDAKLMGLPEKSNYSKRAAALPIRGAPGATQDVEVKLHIIESENVSGQGKLKGTLGDLEVTGDSPLGAGEHVISARLQRLPDEIQWVRGDVEWSLIASSPEATISVGSTPVEVFFVLGKPIKPFEEHGVWAEALRFLCAKAGVVGAKTDARVAEQVTRYCHTGHGLHYDVQDGAAAYGDRGNRFQLKKYLIRGEERCNCYDQASAIQVLCGALGTQVEWRFLEPFGFIKPTNLVGVGMCNNPFFEYTQSDRFTMPYDPKRTSFNNHAFCRLGGQSLDACAGPHTGNETEAEYLEASIDTDPVVYRLALERLMAQYNVTEAVAAPHAPQCGRVDQVVGRPGVSSVY